MARLREMSLRGGGAMHKQTMIHHKMHKNTQDLHAVKETDKHTNTQTQRGQTKERKRGRNHSNPRCCGQGVYVLLR